MKRRSILLLIVSVAAAALIALRITLYTSNEVTQRAAHFYDPERSGLFIRGFSAAIRLAGEYSSLTVFAVLFIISFAAILRTAILAQRAPRWLGLSRTQHPVT